MQTLPAEQFEAYTEGLFHISEELYHDHVRAPYVNRGLIVTMLSTTAAHAKALLDGTAAKKKPTPAMVIGSLMDKALLEPDRFKEGLSHWVKPAGLKLSTKEGMGWKCDHPDLPYIPAVTDSATEASAEDIRQMIESVMRHKIARRIVEQSVKQESAFCIDPETGLMRKCRPDTRLADNNGQLTLADLKTTFPGGASDSAFSVHCGRMAYHIQSEFYSDIYRDLTGEKTFFLFMVVERKPPYALSIFQIDLEGKNAAHRQYKQALRQFKECKESGVWPTYPEHIRVIRLPRWTINPPDPVVLD